MNTVNPDLLAEALAGAPKRARKPRAHKTEPKPSSGNAIRFDYGQRQPWSNPLHMGCARAPRPTGALARTVKRLIAVAADHSIRVETFRRMRKPVLLPGFPGNRELGWLDRVLCLPEYPLAYQAAWIAHFLGEEFYGSGNGLAFGQALVSAVYAAELARAPRPGKLRMRACVWGSGRRRTRLPR